MRLVQFVRPLRLLVGLVIVLTIGLGACGKTGKLTLPGEDVADKQNGASSESKAKRKHNKLKP